MTDKTEITETKEGVKVEVELTRGTGTRDQDKIRVRSYYDDMTEARENWQKLHGLAAAQADAARKVQPDESDRTDPATFRDDQGCAPDGG